MGTRDAARPHVRNFITQPACKVGLFTRLDASPISSMPLSPPPVSLTCSTIAQRLAHVLLRSHGASGGGLAALRILVPLLISLLD
ncbi:hypothetical protein RTBOTA2_001174 [Rhodotorula toruloides]|nr:hypothetical protein RTBOTA2_001174 [Rhodotorula toruloides]